MITNERQYGITKAEIGRFEESLSHAYEQGRGLHPDLQQAMRRIRSRWA